MEDRLREQIKDIKRTSLGSEYVAFHASRDDVVALAESDLVNTFPGLALAHVIRFIQLRSGKSSDYLEVYEAIRDLLAKDALELREEAEEYELAS